MLLPINPHEVQAWPCYKGLPEFRYSLHAQSQRLFHLLQGCHALQALLQGCHALQALLHGIMLTCADSCNSS